MQITRCIRFFIILVFFFSACQNEVPDNNFTNTEIQVGPKISLAQWSFQKAIFSGEMSNFDFIRTAGEMGFDGVEYVSQFFQDKVEDFVFLDSLKSVSAEVGVKSLMIMVDNAGNLAASNKEARDLAVENCKKWVLAAKYLGCKSIRVNAHGDGSPAEMKAASIDAIGRLGSFAKKEGVLLLVENHGGISSNGTWLVEVLTALEPQGVGAIADFNNWCYEREGGGLWDGACLKEYDRYKGMQELMPFAKSVSAKSFDFDEAGEETSMDYEELIGIVQESGFDGYLGIEFDSDKLPSREGVEKTRALIKKYWSTTVK